MLLGNFLPLIGSFIILLFCFDINNANSTQIKNNTKNIPVKRPLNLLNLEESADTIFNLVQKIGAKPVGKIKKTKLKKKRESKRSTKKD